jgi:hypothetical protein
MELEKFVRICSIFSPVVPLIAFMRTGRQKAYQTTIVVLICFSFASDLITSYIIRRGNYYMLHGYGLLESVLLLLFFSQVMPSLKSRIYIIGVIFTLYYVINSLTFEYMKFNAYGRSVECLLMIALSLTLFYKFYQEEEDIFIDQSPLFWMNIAILVYFSGALFSFILSRQILASKALPWTLHNVCNVLKNLLFALALWKIQPFRRKAT